MIRPIPDEHGVGFCSLARIEPGQGVDLLGYKESLQGRYWDYYFTKENYLWPGQQISGLYHYHFANTIDGFSPNLNKQLHVGHLRQLALANSLSKFFANSEFVALLGASMGVKQEAVDALERWFAWLDYHPTLYYDVLMPIDDHIVPRRKEVMPKKSKDGEPPVMEECEVWDGPNGPVIVTRSDGRRTYAFHDLSFAYCHEPSHYITGIEQTEHFSSLGLEDQHLPMGLVLGSDGKKLKSRTGEAMLAEDVLAEIVANLTKPKEGEDKPREVKYPRELAWNVAAWNMLHVTRKKDVKYKPDEWCKVEAPGLYITYTYARLKKALDANQSLMYGMELLGEDPELHDKDVELLGFAQYAHYWANKCREEFDPAPLASFTHDLARKLSLAYDSDEKIVGGRKGFLFSIYEGKEILRRCMELLGMFPLSEV